MRFFTQLWTLTPVAGSPLRVTTWDRRLSFGGHTYVPASILPTQMEGRSNLQPQQTEIVVSLDSVGITEAQVIGGAQRSARLHVGVVDALDLGAGYFREWKGVVSDFVTINGEVTRAEFLSIAHLLQQEVGDLYSPLCRVVEYGDAECGKDVSAETHTGEVTAVTDSGLFTVDVSEATGYFNHGTLRFTSGANAAVGKKGVKSNTTTTVLMFEDFPFEVEVGDEVEMVRGCDREYLTCIGRGRAKSFRGEPFIPGEMSLREQFPE